MEKEETKEEPSKGRYVFPLVNDISIFLFVFFFFFPLRKREVF